MKVDGAISSELSQAATTARDAEAAGYDGAWVPEIINDPFLPIAVAAEHTERIELGTGIAVAFARNPMSLATLADDLQRFSEGRFILGLGSQIKPHITKRYSMEWSHPAARMREVVQAMHAIWDTWHEGKALDFKGDFYTHTLMTPSHDPGPSPYGKPKVFLAAVGELMTEVVGEVCDGLVFHAFTTAAYLREVTVPALERGAAKAGRSLDDVEISGPAFVVTGTTAGGDGGVSGRGAQADRVLRVDARLPRRAGAPWLGRAPDRAERDVEAGQVGRDGDAHRRRHARRVRHRG